ncbi:unnamed protein product [Staurois parvus]|uniref:Uncharacterized protein n=1 Tax=Staurois parvus TaxID=386267 RepID=A0ABN9EVU6_9NEOB|nr:unnamed protein product [Staurois parvus]
MNTQMNAFHFYFKLNWMFYMVRVYIYFKVQGRTDDPWGPRAIGDHGAPVSLPKLTKSL